MNESCLFCRIVRREIPAEIVLENDDVVAFRDIDGKAPTHILVIPRQHVASLNDATDAASLGALLLAVSEVARREGLTDAGYRTVVNTGAGAGQTVFHLHVHLLGGRGFSWPPG